MQALANEQVQTMAQKMGIVDPPGQQLQELGGETGMPLQQPVVN